MREAFHALLPDFGDGAAPAFDGRPAAAPADGFIPFIGSPAQRSAFDELNADVSEPPVPPQEPVGSEMPGDAAALQSMLSEAFSADMASPSAAAVDDRPEALQGASPVASDPAVETDLRAEPVDHGLELAARDAQIAELTARIEALESAHAAEIARLVEQAVPAMADGVTAAVRATLGAVLAHPLMSVIEAAAVDRFCAELTAMVQAGEGVSVRLSGPETLLEAVRGRWPDGLAVPEMEVADTADLLAIADTAVLSTRLEDAAGLLLGASS